MYLNCMIHTPRKELYIGMMQIILLVLLHLLPFICISFQKIKRKRLQHINIFQQKQRNDQEQVTFLFVIVDPVRCQVKALKNRRRLLIPKSYDFRHYSYKKLKKKRIISHLTLKLTIHRSEVRRIF
jgi:hypothetical protein